METNGNMNKAPEDSNSESSGDLNDISAFSVQGITEEQIDELVRNLCVIMSDTSVDSIVRLIAYVRRWGSENIDYEEYDKEGVFFEGFRVGGEFVQKLYSKQQNERKGTE